MKSLFSCMISSWFPKLSVLDDLCVERCTGESSWKMFSFASETLQIISRQLKAAVQTIANSISLSVALVACVMV